MRNMEFHIFENTPIDIEEIDFRYWLTEDGEYMEIEEMSTQEIKAAIDTLRRKRKLLPEHVNEDIWEKYLYVFQEERYERETHDTKEE